MHRENCYETAVIVLSIAVNVLRCFLAGGSPASAPNNSRLVEVICIRLCELHATAKREVASNGRVYYTSRWRLILAHYNRIRARLLNSRALLTGTDLSLFPLNEVTLKRWFKNAARRNEITLLLQGRQLPEVAESTAKTLPAREPPHSAVLPQHPVIIVEAEDTTGELFRKLVLTFIDEFHCY